MHQRYCVRTLVLDAVYQAQSGSGCLFLIAKKFVRKLGWLLDFCVDDCDHYSVLLYFGLGVSRKLVQMLQQRHRHHSPGLELGVACALLLGWRGIRRLFRTVMKPERVLGLLLARTVVCLVDEAQDCYLLLSFSLSPSVYRWLAFQYPLNFVVLVRRASQI